MRGFRECPLGTGRCDCADPCSTTLHRVEKLSLVAERGSVYGHPSVNFRRIARLWGAYLDRDITPDDVAHLNLLQKIARLQETPGHADSVDDLEGYAETIRMLREKAA